MIEMNMEILQPMSIVSSKIVLNGRESDVCEINTDHPFLEISEIILTYQGEDKKAYKDRKLNSSELWEMAKSLGHDEKRTGPLHVPLIHISPKNPLKFERFGKVIFEYVHSISPVARNGDWINIRIFFLNYDHHEAVMHNIKIEDHLEDVSLEMEYTK
jgi:hypothetical protein